MYRPDTKSMGNIPCASAYYTLEAILKKDADHPPTVTIQPSYHDTLHKISDHILNNKYNLAGTIDKALKDMMINTLSKTDESNLTFFNIDSDAMTSLTNIAHRAIKITCDSNPELNRDTNDYYNQAKEYLASKMSSLIPLTLYNSKEELTSFITTATRHSTPYKDLLPLIIRGANFDIKWLGLIHETMPTGKSGTSTHTLLNTLHNLENDIEHLQSEMIEVDNQITKVGVRIGDLKTSELETRYHQVENVIKLHNINHINENTPNNFQALSHPEKVKCIHNLVSQHTLPSTAFSTKVITPKPNTRQFKPFAIISFSNPANKYDFEKKISDFRRKNPSFKITTSRPQPPKTASDRDIPDEYDIKERLGMLYNQKVKEAQRHNPYTDYAPLTPQEIGAIKVHLKTKQNPFSTYWEFLCPSNNTTFMTYTPTQNPFTDYNFNEKIANPHTRIKATSDTRFEEQFPPIVYKQRN